MFTDLHCHSTASDGTLSPRDVVKLAHQNGISAMALTDHDTIAGIDDAAAAAADLAIDFIPGIEISAEFPHPGTLHILGYGIDPKSKSLHELTQTLLAGRDNRNPKIIAKLQELGISITMQEVEAKAQGDVIGRPHIAAVMMEKGYVSSIKNAFNEYLAPGGKAYFDKERLTPRQAISMIRDAGGIAVIAHPVQLRLQNSSQIETAVKDLVDSGLGGIETIHSDHSPADIEQFTAYAKKYNLVTTGGSDFHGTNKTHIDLGFVNGRRVPRAMFDDLRDALASLRGG